MIYFDIELEDICIVWELDGTVFAYDAGQGIKLTKIGLSPEDCGLVLIGKF